MIFFILMIFFRLNHSSRRSSDCLKKTSVSADKSYAHTHLCDVRFSQLSEENVRGWSSDADSVDVNKLFGVSNGCSPRSLFLFFDSGHVSVVKRGAWSQLAAKWFSFWYCGIYEICFVLSCVKGSLCPYNATALSLDFCETTMRVCCRRTVTYTVMLRKCLYNRLYLTPSYLVTFLAHIPPVLLCF